MSADRRRGRGWWHAIADDPYRKLVAIGLGIVMWFFINSRITKTHTRFLPLRVIAPVAAGDTSSDRLAVHLPTDRVAGKRFLDGDVPIDRVKVVLRGPRYRIDAIENEPLSFAVTTFLARDWTRASGDQGTDELIEFTAADILRDLRLLQGVRIELEPARVRLEVQRRDNVTVPSLAELVAETPTAIDIDAGANVDRLRADTAVYSPDEVTILGSVTGIKRLFERRDVPLFRVVLSRSGNEGSVSGTLEIIGGDDLGVGFQTAPRLEMELLPETRTFTVNLPIIVDDMSLDAAERGRYQPDVKELAVRIRVAGNLRTRLILLSEDSDKGKLPRWAAENLRLQVYLRRPEGSVPYPEEIERQLYLVPAGPILQDHDRSEYLLDDGRTITLRRKK